MLFCNPNAGFYEFSFYQSEWFELYMRLGINLFMWNYPGYGRTRGPPSMKKIMKDGEYLVSYLREVRNVKLIGVHGESLGGCVATYLANKCNLNFLFADRTFASLSEAAFFNFGKIAFCGFKIANGEDPDSVKNFIEAKCYKVISCDPRDMMINDLASLKSGVAWRLVYQKFPKSHILLDKHMKDFYKSLLRIYELIAKLPRFDNISKENESKPSNMYQRLNEDSELFEDEGFRDALQKLKILLNGIDAGGISLLGCFKTKKPSIYVILWILVLDIWGISIPSTRNNNTQGTVEKLRSIIRELEGLMGVIGIKKEISCIHLAFDAIKTHLENRLDISDSRSLSTSQELKLDYDIEKAGHLIPLTCGHGGPFNAQEKFAYEHHLLKSRFISYNY
jgi:Chlamydia CHLPS protein (DUF818)